MSEVHKLPSLVIFAIERILFIDHYNTVRLHSGIGYVTPLDKLFGRDKAILQARDEKLEQARERRRQKRAAQVHASR